MSKNNKTTGRNNPKQVVSSSQDATPTKKPLAAPIAKNEGVSFWKINTLPLLVIFVFSCLLYIQSIGFDYVLDDQMVITKNQYTQKGFDGIYDIFAHESFVGYFGEQRNLVEGDRYRPLSIATFAIEQGLFGGNKAISHLINILLYGLTGVLLFRVLSMMFKSNTEERAERSRKSVPSYITAVPFMATMLFMAHPLHVEVVANIKGRDEIITLIGELGTLYFTMRYLAVPKTRYLVLSFLAYLTAIFSKEGAITFLAIVPITAYFFGDRVDRSKILRVSLPIVIGATVYMMARVGAIGYFVHPASNKVLDLMNEPFGNMALGEKLATVFYTLGLYLKLLVFPSPLTHDYYPYHIPIMHWSDWQSILSLLAYMGLGALAVWGVWKKNVYGYAAAFYLIALSVVSNLFVSVGTFMNERFVYHATLGFCIALGYALSTDSKRFQWLRNYPWGLALFALFLVSFTVRTITRVPDWKSTESLNHAAIKVSPNSARSNLFYGVEMWEGRFLKLPANAITEKKAVLDSMKPYFAKSLSIYPRYSGALKMWAGVCGEYHKIDGNYDTLLTEFDRVNRNYELGSYEPFVVQYLQYLNVKVNNKADATKLLDFYDKTIVYYQGIPNMGAVVKLYQDMKTGIEGKLPLLR